jgi:hypothetical protein
MLTAFASLNCYAFWGKRDETVMPTIHAVWQANMDVYGADKVLNQMNW